MAIRPAMPHNKIRAARADALQPEIPIFINAQKRTPGICPGFFPNLCCLFQFIS